MGSSKRKSQPVQRDRLVMAYPASWWQGRWREALPTGNGTIGAAVYGAVQDETVLINHAELWHGGRYDPLPDVAHTLQLTRQLMAEGRYQEANGQLVQALKEQGYASRLASPQPLAHLRIRMPTVSAFTHYERALDMSSGEVAVSWQDKGRPCRRRIFASRADDCLVLALDLAQGATCELSLDVPDSENSRRQEMVDALRGTASHYADDAYLYFAARHEQGEDYGVVMRIVGGRPQPHEHGVKLEIDHTVLVLIKVFVGGERAVRWKQMRDQLGRMDRDYEQLLADHRQLHGHLYHSASIRLTSSEDENLGNEQLLLDAYRGEASLQLLEKLWAYGRYLYICATGRSGNPMPLYGLWGGDYRLTWCHYMANENIQMMNWHAPVGGLSTLMRAVFRHYTGLLDVFRDNARKLYGCRGIFIPAGTTPGSGRPTQIVPVILHWTGAAGWLARHYYEYFLYTNDRDFLVEEALPFMREAALFYEDFLVVDDSGQWLVYPSVSPENTPSNHMPDQGESMAHPMPTTMNATMDLAIIRELFTHLIAATRLVDGNDRDIPRWEQLLQRLPDYQINEEGAVCEWTHPAFTDRYRHRHLSHLYPIFPGQALTRETDPALFAAFEQAVNKREIGAQTGWSMAHMAAVYARLGRAEQALEALDLLTRTCLQSNLFTLHNDWRKMGASMDRAGAPIQLDANLGITHAIQEMLIYVSPDMVKLLPACPQRWKQGRAERLRYCSGALSFEWDRQLGRFEAELEVERAVRLTLVLPAGYGNYRWAGMAEALPEWQPGQTRMALDLRAGQHIRLIGEKQTMKIEEVTQ